MPKPKDWLISRDSTAEDAVKLINEIGKDHQRDQIVQQYLTAYPFEPTVAWFAQLTDFWANKIEYRHDRGGEKVRTPDRIWHDRVGDCDCFSATLAAILIAVNVGYLVKIVKYEPQIVWDHVYLIIPLKEGELNGKNYLTLDVVLYQENRKLFDEVDYYETQVFNSNF